MDPFSTMSENNSWWSGGGGTEAPSSPSKMNQFAPKEMDVPKEQEGEQLSSRRIHILGLGSIGTLLAHSFRCLPNPPPVTLLMHRPELYEDFKRKGRIIRLINVKNDVNDEQTGYDVDVLETDQTTGYANWNYIPDRPELGGEPTNPVNEQSERLETGELYIQCLIVTVKGPATTQAMRSIKHRVNAQSTICFVQNGMGQIEELNKRVFTDPNTRPTYMLGIISHGAYLDSSFCVVHAGFGTVALGIYRDTDKYPLPPKRADYDSSELSEEDRKLMHPTDEELYANLSSRYLLRTLTRSPILACAAFPYLDLFQLQLEKLSTNCLINPVTALLDILNGQTLSNKPLGSVRRLLLAEIAMVIRGLPELEGVPNVRMRFSPERLETACLGQAQRTAANSSSMREDLRKNKDAEIDYINGYVIKRGEEQGIKCVLNYMLMQLVKGKQICQKNEGKDVKPYGTSQVESSTSLDGSGQPGLVTLEETGTIGKGKKDRS